MRLLLASAFVLASTIFAAAQTPGTAGSAIGQGGFAGPTFDVPATPTTVYILRRELAPGEAVAMHTHPGVEMTEVIAGDFDVNDEGKILHYHAGDSFMVARGIKHAGKNVGTTKVVLAVTYVLDKGAPLRTEVK